MFGTELPKRKTYEFPEGSKIALYTWHGCTLKVKIIILYLVSYIYCLVDWYS